MSQDTSDLNIESRAEPTADRPGSMLARLGAEALGTFALVLVGVGTLLYTQLSGAGALGTALAFGLVVVGAGYAVGHISGGHFNPAITLGAVLAGRTPLRELVPYWLAQVIGGALAAGALLITIPDELGAIVGADGTQGFMGRTVAGWGEQSPLFLLTQGQVSFGMISALVVELLGAVVLVAVALGASRRRRSRRTAPLAIGLTYAAVLLVALPVSNGSINPARATASALFGGELGQLWLFWVAPLVGAALVGLVYRAFSTDGDLWLSVDASEDDASAEGDAEGDVEEIDIVVVESKDDPLR